MWTVRWHNVVVGTEEFPLVRKHLTEPTQPTPTTHSSNNTDLNLHGALAPMTLVKEWEQELERLSPQVQVMKKEPPSFHTPSSSSFRHVVTPPNPTTHPIPSQLLPGAREIIDFFQSKGLPQGIATSSSSDLVTHKRQHHEAEVFARMDTVVTGDDPAVGKKVPPLPFHIPPSPPIHTPKKIHTGEKWQTCPRHLLGGGRTIGGLTGSMLGV